MTTFEQIDAAIAAKGIRYDAESELFYDGKRPLEAEELLAIVGEVTLDELASFQDDKYDQRAK